MVQLSDFDRDMAAGEACGDQKLPEFKSMAERSAWAAQWVADNNELLRNKIWKYHRSSPSFALTEMDIEDFFGDAIVLLTEATVKAERKQLPWYVIFWFEFDRMLVGTQELHYRMPFADIENELPATLAANPDAESIMLEFSDRIKQEEIDEFALRSAVPFMSPREKEAFDLIVRGSLDGRPVSSDKAGAIMGIDGSDVRKMIRNVQAKVQEAGRLYFNDGRVMLFPMPWGPKIGSAKGQRRSRSGRDNMIRATA